MFKFKNDFYFEYKDKFEIIVFYLALNLIIKNCF